MEWYLQVFRRYAEFSGRSRRKEYWMFFLFNLIFSIVAVIIDNITGMAIEGIGYGIIYILYSLVMLVPGLAVAVRRLHDINKSGLWLLILLIPIIGVIWFIILMARNKYGTDPKAVPAIG